MNLRKKLIIGSVLMLLIPVFVSVVLCVIVVFYQGDSTLNRMKTLYENDNGLLNVQTILYNYEKKILDFEPDREDDWDEEDEVDDEDQNRESEWDEEEIWESVYGNLIRELDKLGYTCRIRYNKKEVINTIPEGAKETILNLAGEKYNSDNNFALAEGKNSVVKRLYFDGKKKVEVLAFCNDYENANHFSQFIRDFLDILLLFCIVLIVTIALSIFLLTRWMSAGMQQSLQYLSDGVKQVQEGNLSYRIGSRRKDELGKACQEFDEMAACLERSVKERENYEEQRKQMIAGISHDLRTPLTSIKAYVEGLRDGIANTEEKKQRYYDALYTRTADMESLIDNLSLFSRFDRGEYHYSMETIEMNEFLTCFFRENEIEFQKNQLTLHCYFPSEEQFYIKGDKKQLKRVLGNLIDNTLKYREKEASVLISRLFSRDERIFVEIEDDGPGVPEMERKRIFDTFYRGDTARRDPGKGSGLGLSIVKEILKGHGAEVYAKEGEGGRGLKIIMDFPKKREEEK